MTENPLLLKGFTSGWIQKFFNEPLDPICVMLAMRTRLMLDVIDEMGHSYNLLRNLGLGWIDFGEVPGEVPGNPSDYYPPGIDNPIVIAQPVITPGPGEPGYVPPKLGEPGYGVPMPGEPGYVPPGPGEPGYMPPPTPTPPGGWPEIPTIGAPRAGIGGAQVAGGGGSIGSGAFGFGPGDLFPGPARSGAPAGGGGGINCCLDKDNQAAYVHIDYTTLEMDCGETQALTVGGYNPVCDELWYEWAALSIGGSVSPIAGYTTVFTAPASGVDCKTPQTIALYCNETQVSSIEISIGTCPTDAAIGYTTQQMSVNGTQTLTAVPGAAGCGEATFDWAITSGGGSLSASTGASVIYTAPATNAECANNPTISLSCGGVELDTLEIAVSNTGFSPGLSAARNCCQFQQYPPNWYNCTREWNCYSGFVTQGVDARCTSYCGWPDHVDFHNTDCSAYGGVGMQDRRTAQMKTQGCCPSILL